MDWDKLRTELTYLTSRSGGPGGQHVNKVSSKVTIKFDLLKSDALSEEEKQRLLSEIKSGLTDEGVLMIVSQQHRSQLANKEAAVEKLRVVLTKGLQVKKVRKASKPTKASAEKRILSKKQHAEKKKWRQRPI